MGNKKSTLKSSNSKENNKDDPALKKKGKGKKLTGNGDTSPKSSSNKEHKKNKKNNTDEESQQQQQQQQQSSSSPRNKSSTEDNKKEKHKGKNKEKTSKESVEDKHADESGSDNNEGNSVDSDDIDPSWNDPVLFSGDTFTNRVTNEDFELLMVIGKGSFGKVMQVRKKDDGKIYAMKVLRKEAIIARKQVAHTKAEKTILQKIQHPFIVKLHYAFQTDAKLYMILDYINGGELFYHLKREGRFPEQRVVFYAAEIVLALSHLHTLDIVYRDLKPENILLNSEGHIVLTDFGLSKEINPTEGTQTFCGTPEYLAPEVLKGQGHGIAVDWWSLGTLMYEMLTGLPPFYSQNINIMYQKILNGDLRFPTYISSDAQSLLEGLLTRDPTKRMGSQLKDASDIKEHAFFKAINWEKLYAKDVTAPFVPQVKSEADITHIDPVFTQEKAIDSVVETSELTKTAEGEGHFEGFTFVGDNIMEETAKDD